MESKKTTPPADKLFESQVMPEPPMSPQEEKKPRRHIFYTNAERIFLAYNLKWIRKHFCLSLSALSLIVLMPKSILKKVEKASPDVDGFFIYSIIHSLQSYCRVLPQEVLTTLLEANYY